MLKLTAKKTKWFTVTQDESGETQIEILYLKPGEVADIESRVNQITGKQVEGGDGFRTEIDYNLSFRTKEFIKRAVIDWKGFLSVTDKPLNCTDQNKMKVLQEFGWFGAQVEEFRAEFAEEIEAEEEEVEKN